MAEKLAPSERHAYIVNGRTIYEWDQTLRYVVSVLPTEIGT